MAVARVLAIPPDNVYVRAVTPAETLVSVALTDREASGWDLHPAFTPGWLRRHRGELDVVHLHFGFERLTVPQLEAWLRELVACGLPLVLTVHDLRNPHLADREHHDRQLRLLLAAADRVITLTAGAAAELAARFGVEADVLAHPLVVDDANLPAAVDVEPTVGVYLKQRAQVVDADEIVAAVELGAARCGARVVVDAHPAVVTQLPQTAVLALAGRVQLRTTGYLEGGAFPAYLAGLSVSVLPYRFGTHSGWLEACRDVGTAVVAPDCGHYAEQWDQALTYSNNERTGFDAASLIEAVVVALTRPVPAPADRQWRAGQQRDLQAAHRAVYAALTDDRLAA